MTIASWQAVLAIAIGSVAGAGLRFVVGGILERASGLSLRAYVVTGIGGLVLGASAGWIAHELGDANVFGQAMIAALIAALATYSASGGLQRSGAKLSERSLILIGLHVVAGILTALAGFTVTYAFA